jgi:glycosyltransferase involved in cell wall biosynthesis
VTPSHSHLVLIPSYNTGAILAETLAGARAAWAPVWLVIDGTTDGSADALQDDPATGFRVLRLPRNRGKGAAVMAGLMEAEGQGFTHALVMDADGQHPAAQIAEFMAASIAAPDAMVLGVPVFGPEAPQLRVRGRRISNGWANLETLGAGVGDSLFGFRVYPIAPLLRIMRRQSGMRRFDFDPEAAVRLSWAGVPALNLPAKVRYVAAAEGGVSHFRYARDNVLLTRMHARLFFGMIIRLPMLLARRFSRRP